MPTSRIIWTTLEQQRLAAWCAQRVALRLNVDVTDLTRETLRKHHGFFTDVFCVRSTGSVQAVSGKNASVHSPARQSELAT